MTIMTNLLLIFIGGGLGSLSRYGTGVLSARFYHGNFPLGTFISNTASCLILGLTLYFLRDRLASTEWAKYFILVGFCGGFSTFSAFGLETVKLIQTGQYLWAMTNVVISISAVVAILWFVTREIV